MPIQGRSRTGIINMPCGGGVVADDVSQEVAEQSATSALNVRFRDGFAWKTEGYTDVLTAPSAAALHIAPLQANGTNWWVHFTASGVAADNGATQSNITGTALTGGINDRFTSSTLGGVLVFNNQVDAPRYWGGTGNTSDLTAWPATYRCKAMRAHDGRLIALNITKGTANYASMVKTSHLAAPGFLPDSWDETDPTRDAVERDIAETDDELVDGLSLGKTFILYKERSAHALQFLQNSYILKTWRLPGNYGILSQNCVADTPVGHVVLTSNADVIVHYANEPRSIVQGRFKRWLESNLDTTNYRASFVVSNVPRREVWICIPTTGSTYCNRALVWNYDTDTLTLIALPNLTHAALGRYETSTGTWATGSDTWADADGSWDQLDNTARLLASSGDSKLYLMDEGDDADGSQISTSFERLGLSFGDPEIVKQCYGATLRVDAPAGTVLSVEGAYSNDVEGSWTYASPVTYTVGTSRKADFIVSGRFLGVRITSSAGGNWRIKSIGWNIKAAGDY